MINHILTGFITEMEKVAWKKHFVRGSIKTPESKKNWLKKLRKGK